MVSFSHFVNFNLPNTSIESTEKQVDFVKEYECLSELHRKEMAQAVKTYEVQITHLKEKVIDLQEKVTKSSDTSDQLQKENSRLMRENNELEKKILILQKDQEIHERVKIEHLMMENCKFKENQQEAKKVYKEKEEKLMSQLDSANKEIKKLTLEKDKITLKKTQKPEMISLDSKISLLVEELSKTKQENKELKTSIKEFGRQIHSMKAAPVQYMNLAEEDEVDPSDLFNEIDRLEAYANQKSNEIQHLSSTYKNLMNMERQKVVKTKEKMIEMRDKFDQKKNELMQEILEKDQTILKLTMKVRENKTQKGFDSSRPADLENLSVAEYKLLRICQNMVDSASRIE
jgi:hypothetical protein